MNSFDVTPFSKSQRTMNTKKTTPLKIVASFISNTIGADSTGCIKLNYLFLVSDYRLPDRTFNSACGFDGSSLTNSPVLAAVKIYFFDVATEKPETGALIENQ